MTAIGEVHIEEKTVHQNEYGNIACNCVAFVLQYRPDIPNTNASDMIIATTTPTKGAVAVMYYPHSGMYHVALVTSVQGDTLTLLDANYTPCAVTERTVTLPDRIIGYM